MPAATIQPRLDTTGTAEPATNALARTLNTWPLIAGRSSSSVQMYSPRTLNVTFCVRALRASPADGPALLLRHELQGAGVVAVAVPVQITCGRPERERVVDQEQVLHAHPVEIRAGVEGLGDQRRSTEEQHLVAVGMGVARVHRGLAPLARPVARHRRARDIAQAGLVEIDAVLGGLGLFRNRAGCGSTTTADPDSRASAFR